MAGLVWPRLVWPRAESRARESALPLRVVAGEPSGAVAGRALARKPSGAVRGLLAAGESGCAVPGWLITGNPPAGWSGEWSSRVLRERRRLRWSAGKGALRLLSRAERTGEVRRARLRAAWRVRSTGPGTATGEGRGPAVSATRDAGFQPAGAEPAETGPAETGPARAGPARAAESRPTEARPACARATVRTGAVRTGATVRTRVTVGTGPAVGAWTAVRPWRTLRTWAVERTGRKARLCHESGLTRVTRSGPPVRPGAPAPRRGLRSRAAGPAAMIPLVVTAVPLAGVAAGPVPRPRRGSPAPSP